MGDTITLKLNGVKFYLHKNNFTFGLIELLILLDSQYSSDDALRDNIDKAFKLFEEYKPSLQKKRVILKKIKSREALIRFYFDTILSLDNMATLRGFSCICSAEHGRSNYNPEKYRMSKSLEEREL